MKHLNKLLVGSAILLMAACGDRMTEQAFKNSDSMCKALPGGMEAEEISANEFSMIRENDYVSPLANPLSTFAIDVDRAGYSLIRRQLNDNSLPDSSAVRIEEMINYFDYNYSKPENNKPFTINTELAVCPWNAEHKLLLVGLNSKPIEQKEMLPGNYVFLIDVSGSMDAEDKLPLLKTAFQKFTKQLREQDKVSIVVYAGAAGCVLEGANGTEKKKIMEAIEDLHAGGSTAGAEGINQAYAIAEKLYREKANNRVILATDGDFNVGISSPEELKKLIEEKRDKGIYLSVLGFGMGNYKDNRMEELADNGNGNYSYIDSQDEADKVLVKEMSGTIQTVAKDVKLQIEFNPAQVKGYRLIGYENRMLAAQDFSNDKKDAGEMGCGHTVTALYEIIPAGSNEKIASIDTLHFRKTDPSGNTNNELAYLKARYKNPEKNDTVSILMETKVNPTCLTEDKISDNFKLAGSVAEFGLLLRNSKYKGFANFDNVSKRLGNITANDPEGYRAELSALVTKAAQLKKAAKP